MVRALVDTTGAAHVAVPADMVIVAPLDAWVTHDCTEAWSGVDVHDRPEPLQAEKAFGINDRKKMSAIISIFIFYLLYCHIYTKLRRRIAQSYCVSS